MKVSIVANVKGLLCMLLSLLTVTATRTKLLANRNAIASVSSLAQMRQRQTKMVMAYAPGLPNRPGAGKPFFLPAQIF
jgi:uncharacterized membrane protein